MGFRQLLEMFFQYTLFTSLDLCQLIRHSLDVCVNIEMLVSLAITWVLPLVDLIQLEHVCISVTLGIQEETQLTFTWQVVSSNTILVGCLTIQVTFSRNDSIAPIMFVKCPLCFTASVAGRLIKFTRIWPGVGAHFQPWCVCVCVCEGVSVCVWLCECVYVCV